MADASSKSDSRTMTYYELLEVPQSASEAEVRRAVPLARKKWSARQSRAGEAGGRARAAMARIAEAEETLLDPARRAAYDRSLERREEAPSRAEDGRDWLSEARGYLARGELDLAEGALEHAMVRGRGEAETWLVAYWVYRSRADRLPSFDQQRGKWLQRADKALQEALLLEPENYACHETQGDARGLTAEAVKAYEMAERYAVLAGDEDAAERVRQKVINCQAWICLNGSYSYLDKSIESVPECDYETGYREQFAAINAEIERLKTEINALYQQAQHPLPLLEQGKKDVFACCDRLSEKARSELERRLAALRQQLVQKEVEKKEEERKERAKLQSTLILMVSSVLTWLVVFMVTKACMVSGNTGIGGTLLALGSAVVSMVVVVVINDKMNARAGVSGGNGSVGCLLPIAYLAAIIIAQLV